MEERIVKKVIIDAYRGGEDVGNSINGIIEKDYNLDLSKYIYNRLKMLGVPVSLTRIEDETLSIDERINKIKSIYGNGDDVITISNALTTGDDGAKIVYALRDNSTLSKKIADSLGSVGIDVNKYYQRRLPSNTSKDYYQLIRDTANNESIIVYYGNINNADEASFLKNNLENIGEAVVMALCSYLNISYRPNFDGNYYAVKKGDTLFSIASSQNTTVDKIKSLNNLVSDNLSVGQLLKLPLTNGDGVVNNNESFYIVKKGDNLYQIAKKFGTTVDEIKKSNNLLDNILTVGQKLMITTVNSKENNDEYFIYEVVLGDSLYSIARRYNTTVEFIKDYNNLSSNLLRIGQKLKIPRNIQNDIGYSYYIIKSGDSLYSIARRYNTTVDELKVLNGLGSNLLSIGQILKIPN